MKLLNYIILKLWIDLWQIHAKLWKLNLFHTIDIGPEHFNEKGTNGVYRTCLFTSYFYFWNGLFNQFLLCWLQNLAVFFNLNYAVIWCYLIVSWRNESNHRDLVIYICVTVHHCIRYMMTSSNGSIFRITGHLCGEFTGPQWIPHTKASDAELWCLLWSAPG